MAEDTPEGKLLGTIFGAIPAATIFSANINTEAALTEATRERIKLRAQYANGLAIGFFAVGVLGPMIALVNAGYLSDNQAVLLPLTAILCFAASFVLHLYGIRTLGDLDP